MPIIICAHILETDQLMTTFCHTDILHFQIMLNYNTIRKWKSGLHQDPPHRLARSPLLVMTPAVTLNTITNRWSLNFEYLQFTQFTKKIREPHSQHHLKFHSPYKFIHSEIRKRSVIPSHHEPLTESELESPPCSKPLYLSIQMYTSP